MIKKIASGFYNINHPSIPMILNKEIFIEWKFTILKSFKKFQSSYDMDYLIILIEYYDDEEYIKTERLSNLSI